MMWMNFVDEHCREEKAVILNATECYEDHYGFFLFLKKLVELFSHTSTYTILKIVWLW